MRILKLIVYNFLVFVLLLTACEACATAFYSARNFYRRHWVVRQAALTGTLDQPEGAAFQKEEDRAELLTWTSYSYWRRAPVSGQYVNVDANGLRRTWNPPDLSHRRIRVFMFGGSAVWGTGSRDEYTIPSQLSRMLAKSFGSRVEVVNYGEWGYVTTQELIALLKEIQRGNAPSVAIFYDGYNDIFSAFQNGAAGLPQNEMNRVREFNLLQSGPRFYLEWVRRSSLSILLSNAASRLRRASDFARYSRLADDGRLIDDLLSVYCTNVKIIKAVGLAYNIRILNYWQPSVYTKANPTTEERAVAASDPLFQRFHRSTIARLKSSPIEKSDSFRDLTGAFDGHQERVFADGVHISERGNESVAGLIANDVAGAARQLLQQQ
jgi:lysophospholipase L1-like esterase